MSLVSCVWMNAPFRQKSNNLYWNQRTQGIKKENDFIGDDRSGDGKRARHLSRQEHLGLDLGQENRNEDSDDVIEGDKQMSYMTYMESIPSPRHNLALATKGEEIYIFGGKTVDEQIFYHNDMHCLKVHKGTLYWRKIHQEGDIPLERAGHMMCNVGRRIYLYGGCDDESNNECLPGLFVFHLDSSLWEECVTTGLTPRMLGATMVSIQEVLYIFGGWFQTSLTDSVHMIHVLSLQWGTLNATGHPPSKRCDHSACAVGNVMYVFGGRDKAGMWFNDIYSLDTACLAWTQVDTYGDPPPPRACCSFTPHHRKDIYVLGGRGSGQSFCDFGTVYKLSLSKMKWKRPVCLGTPPEKRWAHIAAVIHGHLYLMFGRDEEKSLNSTGVLKLINPSDRLPVKVRGQHQTTLKPGVGYHLQTLQEDLFQFKEWNTEPRRLLHQTHMMKSSSGPVLLESSPSSKTPQMGQYSLAQCETSSTASSFQMRPLHRNTEKMESSEPTFQVLNRGAHEKRMCLPPVLSSLNSSVALVEQKLKKIRKDSQRLTEAREMVKLERCEQDRRYRQQLQELNHVLHAERQKNQALLCGAKKEMKKSMGHLQEEKMKLQEERRTVDRERRAVIDLSLRLQRALDTHTHGL